VRQAASASAVGTSWMKGVVAMTVPAGRSADLYVYSVMSTSVPACSPVASSATTM
jgi:hypothetical protein